MFQSILSTVILTADSAGKSQGRGAVSLYSGASPAGAGLSLRKMSIIWGLFLALLCGTETGVIGLLAAESRGIQVVGPLPTDQTIGNAALFVGVGSFEANRGLSDLRYTVDDAVALAYFLIADIKLIPIGHARLAISGQPSRPLRQRQLKELKDSGLAVSDATRKTIYDLVDEVTRKLPVKSDSLILISFATHGHENGGDPYVMPSDGDIRRIVEYGVSLKTVQQDLQRCIANKKLLIVDACRETIESSKRGGQTADERFMKELKAAEGTALISSCSSGEVSWEDQSFGHGIFMHYFLEGLSGKAEERGGFITLGNASKYAAKKVLEWTRGQGRIKQEPRFDGELAREIPFGISRAETAIEQRLRAAVERLQGAIRFHLDLQPPIERACIVIREQTGARLTQCLAEIESLAIVDRSRVEGFLSAYTSYDRYLDRLTRARSSHPDLGEKIQRAQDRFFTASATERVTWQFQITDLRPDDRTSVQAFLIWAGVIVTPPPPPPPLVIAPTRFRAGASGGFLDSQTGTTWFFPFKGTPVSGDNFWQYVKEAKKNSKWKPPTAKQIREIAEGPPGGSVLPVEFGVNASLLRVWLDSGVFASWVFDVSTSTERRMTSSDYAVTVLVDK